MNFNDKSKFDRKEYNRLYREKNKEKMNNQSREKNYIRYHNDEEYRKHCIETAKISVKKQREIKKLFII
jgi:hypothetical protein